MALIRCRTCKLDTSDSLETCPSCSAPLKGGAPRAVPAPPEAAHSSPSVPGPEAHALPAEPAQVGGVTIPQGQLARAAIGIALLVWLLLVPNGFGLALLGLFAYWLLRGRRRTSSTLRQEVLRKLLARTAVCIPSPTVGRPLELLRQIEEELREKSARDRS